MIREKDLIRKQITDAMDRQDFEAAQNYMDVICKNERCPTQRRWLKDEEEFLMHHVASMGLHKACEVVGRKLDRNHVAVRAKYYALVRKGKRS